MFHRAKKFVRSKDYVADFCSNKENAERWIKFRGRTGYNYRHQHSFFERIVDEVKIEEGTRVLDLCCGEGALFRYYKEKHPGLEFDGHGLDVSFWFLKYINQEMPWVQTVQGDAFKLPYADGSFDLVFDISISGMFPYVEYEKIMAEINRVLKPKGRRVTRHNNPLSLYHLIEQAKYDFVKHAYTRSAAREQENRMGFSILNFIGDYLAPSWFFYRHEQSGLHKWIPDWFRLIAFYFDVKVLARLFPWFTASLIVESQKR
ncbi:MAG: hypothetical protein COB46_01180 [Rhodospirillaceae bacterium]|nr:MAG: hypothetical protein COB46_01180 [Rhodospirillaceae bacterium]